MYSRPFFLIKMERLIPKKHSTLDYKKWAAGSFTHQRPVLLHKELY